MHLSRHSPTELWSTHAANDSSLATARSPSSGQRIGEPVTHDVASASRSSSSRQRSREPTTSRCKSCGNTGVDFLSGAPCTCAAGRRLRITELAQHSVVEDIVGSGGASASTTSPFHWSNQVSRGSVQAARSHSPQRAVDPMSTARCRSCGNSGVDLLTGATCVCAAGRRHQAVKPHVVQYGAPDVGGSGAAVTSTARHIRRMADDIDSSSACQQAEWDRLDCEQNHLFDYQWKIITGFMTQISTLADGLSALRQELQLFKCEHVEQLNRLSSKVDVCAPANDLTSRDDRLTRLERFIGESADIHATVNQSLDEAHKRLEDFSAHHASTQQRFMFFEKVIGEYTEHYVKLKELDEALRRVQDTQSRIKGEVDARDRQHDQLHERVDHLEKFIAQSSDKHAEELARAFHQVQEFRGHLEGTWDKQRATIDQRLAYIENLLGDSVEKNTRHSREIEDAQKILQEFESLRSRLFELERVVNVSTSKLSQADASHQRIQELHGHYTSMLQKLDRLEKLIGYSTENYDQIRSDTAAMGKHHGTIEDRLGSLEVLVREIGGTVGVDGKLQQSSEDHVYSNGNYISFQNRAHLSFEDRVNLIQRIEFLEAKVCDNPRYEDELRIASELELQQAQNRQRVSMAAHGLHHPRSTCGAPIERMPLHRIS